MAHPLLSWDIVMEGLSRRQMVQKDLDALVRLRERNNWTDEINWQPELLWAHKVIVVTDPSLVIIHATENMYSMTGYLPEEVIGKTPRMFQGPATTEAEKKVIREAIANQQPFDTVITNYRKDKSVYRCRVEAYPVYNKERQLVNFIAFERAA